MEIRYNNTAKDFQAYYEVLWSSRKSAARAKYYQTFFWYLAVVGLAAFVAVRNEEAFALCLFFVLGVFYVAQNWSYGRRVRGQASWLARMMPETKAKLVVEETGLTEQTDAVQMRVNWSDIQGYTVQRDHLFIQFVGYRAFIIPFRDVPAASGDDLIRVLEQHNLKKKTVFL